jgi:isopenicillin N synthase-like dioxygenase
VAEIARLMEVTSTIGFFYAVDHGAGKELMAGLRGEANKFFDLEVADKEGVRFGGSPAVYRGWS